MIGKTCRVAYSLIALLIILTLFSYGQTASPGHCSASSPSGYSGSIFDGPYTYADYMGCRSSKCSAQ